MVYTLTRYDSKGRHCDYTPPPFQPLTTAEPLVSHSDTCEPDLSPRGAADLLRTITASLTSVSNPFAAPKLSDLVSDMLDLADIDLASALEDFSPSVQQWCPILQDDVLCRGAQNLLPAYPLLSLGIWLLTRKACEHPEHLAGCQLYQTLKQALVLLQTRNEVEVEALQLGLLIAVFEVGHRLEKQAFQTLGSCKAMLVMLELDAQRDDKTKVLEVLDWLKASLVMLDRFVVSFLNPRLPATHTNPQDTFHHNTLNLLSTHPPT